MWVVYRKGDPIECGFEMPSEKEAIEYCRENNEFDYVYIG